MSIKITATCGGKSVSIECKRPSWESAKKAYLGVKMKKLVITMFLVFLVYMQGNKIQFLWIMIERQQNWVG